MSKKVSSVIKNVLTAAAIIGLATAFCLLLQHFALAGSYVQLLFVLAVLFVARFTDGYVYGIIASMAAVVCVNYVFTYPYFEINFEIAGYSVTFVAMLVVACSISALTTQIKKQEQIRLEAEREKMRGNLLRAVSHDIRTPLTSIVGSASGIIDNYDVLSAEKRLELVKDIREEAQWLIRIVENLLSVTRIGAGGAQLTMQEELAEEIISGAVEKFHKRFPEITVQVRLPDEVVLVPMDGILIEQVLVNLMENSVIHGKTTTCVTIAVTDRSDRVIFSVEDNGQGIRPAMLPKIFEGSLSSEDAEGGDSKRNMGIGLSVCMSIVKAHHGDMFAENNAAGGARVMFWLPRDEEEQWKSGTESLL